jgi:hypothetical protein
MRYMFRPHRAIFRQNTFKEFTALCALSVVVLKYVVVIIINFDVIECLFFLSFLLRPLSAPLGTGNTNQHKINTTKRAAHPTVVMSEPAIWRLLTFHVYLYV